MAEAFDVLIVGGGQGGAQAAVMLRQHGFSGTIAIVGEEPYAPYDRPPLSKEYLLGDKTFEKMLLQTPEAWADKRVDLLTGRRVVTVDAAAHEVRTADSACIRYGKLIWAAGGAARKLGCGGANLAGIHTVRNRADVDQLLCELPSVTSAVVIGGGYIGLEAAAALTKLGKQVTLLEALDRVLARVAGEPLSRFYEGEHRAKGVDVRLGVNVESLEGEGCVSGVRLTGGDLIAAELVIVGIGIVPEVGPLLDAGAKGAGSVRVDEFCRTSLPDVFAIGDCAEHRNSFAAGEWVRVESVQNANDQAATAAKAICGKEEPYTAAPWFWSNQYDLRLQTIGLSRGYDDLVIRGEPASRAFSIVYLRAGRVIALDCVNQVRDYTHGRALVLAGAAPDRARLADATIQLKTLLG